MKTMEELRTPPVEQRARGRVLVVDDDPDILELISIILREEGMDVLIARSGRQALHLLRTEDGVDVVLLDLVLPETDGFAVLEAMHHKGTGSNVPVVAFSAHDSMRFEALEAGAEAFLPKPFELDQLVSTVRDLGDG